jgi:hypothetical protein
MGGERLRGRTLLVETDNMAARGAVGKMASKAADMQELVRRLFRLSERHGFGVRVTADAHACAVGCALLGFDGVHHFEDTALVNDFNLTSGLYHGGPLRSPSQVAGVVAAAVLLPTSKLTLGESIKKSPQ